MMLDEVKSIKWFQSNRISFGFPTHFAFVTNASILHFNRELVVMAKKNFL